VLFRLHVLTILAAVCSGCASGPLAPPSALGSPEDVFSSLGEEGAPRSSEKTLAAKVLAAMALQRTTGRAPDPARLSDLD